MQTVFAIPPTRIICATKVCQNLIKCEFPIIDAINGFELAVFLQLPLQTNSTQRFFLSKKNKMKNLPFFVYGTLRPSCPKKAGYKTLFLQDSIKQVENVALQGAQLYFEDYPIVQLNNDNNAMVKGDLIYFSDQHYAAKIKQADEIEGHPTFYQRITCNVSVAPNSEKIEAYIYIRKPSKHAKLIPSGNWLEYFKK